MTPLSRALLAARRTETQIAFDPSLGEVDEELAYVVQAQVAAGMNARPAGWKVGRSSDGRAFAAPILARDAFAAGASIALPKDEPVLVEVELAVLLRNDLPRRLAPYARAELFEATEAVFVGLELVRPRLRADPPAPFAARLADNFNNHGFVAGERTTDILRLNLEALRVRLWADGVLVEDSTGSHAMVDPVAPVIAWASAQRDQLGGLRAGQFITTGNLTKPLAVWTPLRIDAEIQGVGVNSALFGREGLAPSPLSLSG